MERRHFFPALLFAVPVLAETEGRQSVRGSLTEAAGRPAIRTAEGKLVFLHGDEQTEGVLRDDRVKGADFEAVGRYTAADQFEIDPIHKRNLFVHKDGKRLMVTYWCDVCAIRTYTPGKCMCCQDETAIDLREHDEP